MKINVIHKYLDNKFMKPLPSFLVSVILVVVLRKRPQKETHFLSGWFSDP